MQSYTVDKHNSDIKIEKYLQIMYPYLSYSSLQKAFRKKDIKANGTRVGRDYIVRPGDKLEIYIVDDLLYGTKSLQDSSLNKNFSIVFEDENILIVNKEQGIPVHPDREQSAQTLIDQVRAYLAESDEHKGNSGHFQPSLCHRLDRNTGGLVIIAKNQVSLDTITDKLESREIKKYYQCLVKGKMDKPQARLKAWLWKDAEKSRVYINEHKTTGAMEIITSYRVISYNPQKDVSLLEIELVTGRTHQIRAHLAFTGHPIIGDGKYGINSVNKAFRLKQQALWAYKIKFSFSGRGSFLDYLDNMEFSVKPGFDEALSRYKPLQ